LGGEGIREAVRRYYKDAQQPHHRYRSWEHCYQFFRHRSDIDRDVACLHLGFYLASSGMLRGSTQLLKKDYKVHREAVDLILSPQYDCLRDLSLVDAQRLQGPLFELISSLREVYQRLLINGDGDFSSDTLVTKALLGTLGCIPAYDRFFVRGMRNVGLTYSGLKPINFRKMVCY